MADTSPPPNQPNQIDIDSWVDRYGDLLYRFALYRVHDKATAEDLVQDTFVAALNSTSSFAARSTEQTWLLGILKHKILDFYRHSFSAFNASTDSTGDIDTSFTEKGAWRQQLEQWSELPDNELSRKEFLEVLKVCLDHLPDVQCNVFLLREVDGYSTEEICKDSGLTSTNLWVLLHRARKKLRDCLTVNWFAKDGT